jgi:pilus assembly protein CpaB
MNAMNVKAIVPLVVGLVIAGVAAKLGLDFIKKAEGKQTKVVELWTPKQDIQRGVLIDETMLQPVKYPAELAPPGALANRERIVGRIPHTGAPAGLPILDAMLLPPGQHAGVQVPPGLRAVAVKIDESSGVDNHLEPGCHVDVVGMFTIRGKGQADTVARTILQDVEVAAVGDRLAPSTPGPDGETGGRSSKRERPVRAVTLLVKPEQVPTLHLAEQKGKIKLCMRGVADSSRMERIAQVDEGDLLGTKEPEPQLQTQPQQKPTWEQRIAGFFGSLQKGPEQPANVAAQPDAQTAAGAEPSLVWVMTVQNGDERQLLGWRRMEDFQPIQIGSSGGLNVFEETPPSAPIIGTRRASQVHQSKGREVESQADPDESPENESITESELEELFE